MFGRDLRPPIFYYDHGATYTTSVARNEHGPMMVIDVHADELAEPPCPAQSPKITDKARGIPSEADDTAVHVHDKCMVAVDFCAGR